MKIYTYWMQRKEQYEGEYAPELLVAWDEVSLDANPEGFEEAVQEAKKSYDVERQAAGTAFVTLDVSYQAIRDLCLQKHDPLKAKIVEGEIADSER